MAQPASQASEWRSEAYLLRIGFGQSSKAMKNAERAVLEHVDVLLKSNLGRDFTLIAKDAVRGDVCFDIHKTMVIGTSEVLEDHVFPGKIHNLNIPEPFNVPAKFPPAMVSRLVHHMYKGSYPLDRGGKLLTVKHFSTMGNTDPEVYALHEFSGVYAHIRIYDMAEWFKDRPLMDTAYTRMVDILLKNMSGPMTPQTILTLVTQTWCSDQTRVCADEDGSLRRLVAIAALMSFEKHWTAEEKLTFNTIIQPNKQFLAECSRMTIEHGELLKALVANAGNGKGKKGTKVT